jgi:NUMOD4 motif/HNH endonuclease
MPNRFKMGHFDTESSYSTKKTMENWKKIPGYENYSVSDLGRVRNDKTGRIMKTPATVKGYLHLNLVKETGKSIVLVHRLVGKTFIPNPENKPQINHIDGNKKNNNVTNLEWVTQSENIRHAFDNGMIKRYKGQKNPNSKLTEVEVLEIRRLRNEGWKQEDIANKFDVHQTLISAIDRKKTWTHI